MVRRFSAWFLLTTLAVGSSCAVGACAQQSLPGGARPDSATQDPATQDRAAQDQAAQDQAATHQTLATLYAEVSARRLRDWHDQVSSEPHPAGSPGDLRLAKKLAAAFGEMGLEVQEHAFFALLAEPKRAELALVEPVQQQLAVRERAVPGDEFSRDERASFGFCAYSGSGEVTAEVVYVNRGTVEDFARLEQLGVSCRGKIVIARYGGNYRGYKWKYAEAAGAAGLLIYTDPRDNGYQRGLPWPQGGFANETSIERGSILTLDYAGDPLTPGVPATKDQKRLRTEDVPLPKIPVQPIGWQAAAQIMSRMQGNEVGEGWQGGLPFRYRVTGGETLKVRLVVEQTRAVKPSYNIVATLRGHEEPDHEIVFGCHHDAWTFGASDPCAGLIVVLEAARACAKAANAGWRPRRTIRFAAWGAEEFGLIGSTEWVESRVAALRQNLVAYVNLDMAAMGMRFYGASSPPLQAAITRAAAAVPESGVVTVLDLWLETQGPDAVARRMPSFGSLGGGSDHVAFLAAAGAPCAALGTSGARGVAYHSLYDDLTWYRRTVGDDYRSAELVTKLVLALGLELADRPILPLEHFRYGDAVQQHLHELRKLPVMQPRSGPQLGVVDVQDVYPEVHKELANVARRFATRARQVHERIEAAALPAERRRQLNAALIQIDRIWLRETGLPGRPFYKNLFAAPDETSGYQAAMLPLLRRALERNDLQALAAAKETYLGVFERLDSAIAALQPWFGSNR